jgi:hypothetical protein
MHGRQACVIVREKTIKIKLENLPEVTNSNGQNLLHRQPKERNLAEIERSEFTNKYE